MVLAGDYNVVPTGLDIYPTKSWDRDALLQPQSRAAYQRLLAQGWTDAIRALHPKEPMYTFWDYMRMRWERDGGLRLDHILLSRVLTERSQSAGVDRQIRGMEGASDHAPVWAELRDASDQPFSACEPYWRPREGNDSFAHRSYHALPKTIRRNDGNGAGAIVGFANFLLRFYADERPRAVIVGWDTLDAPTKRRQMFPAYQSGREFAQELIEQLNVLPEFVAAMGFSNAKAPGFEADDFLRRRTRRRGARRRFRVGGQWRSGFFSARLTSQYDPLPVAWWGTRAHRP